MTLAPPLRDRLDKLVRSDRVVLFMKGNRHAPQCGFSATVVRVLEELGPSYATVDVLSDPDVRDGIKSYSDWPTIPQLYVDGTFVGGCDIVKEMHGSGALAELLGVTPEAVEAPSVTITPAAAEAFRAAMADAEGETLRLEIDAAFQHDLFVGPPEPGDLEASSGGLVLRMDRTTARRASGVVIDHISGPGKSGFKIDNPNAPAQVKPLAVSDLKAMLDAGTPLELLDVRTDREREIAAIAGAKPWDAAAEARLLALDKKTTLVFHCHRGIRSMAVADRFLREGFRDVYNLSGGIDAWSITVDPKVPRY